MGDGSGRGIFTLTIYADFLEGEQIATQSLQVQNILQKNFFCGVLLGGGLNNYKGRHGVAFNVPGNVYQLETIRVIVFPLTHHEFPLLSTDKLFL